MKKLIHLIIGLLATFFLFASSLMTAMAAAPVKFKVRIENISSADGQTASNGTKWPFALSPGFWVVHEKGALLFKMGKKDFGKGLEAQAEDGNPEVLAKSLAGHKGVMSSGVFNTPVGATAAGPIVPGGSYEFTFSATPGARLSFAMMFGQSNDLFYSAFGKGIELFDKAGKSISGDITSRIILWDAGTEVNQEPGIGPDQAPRQSAPNTGKSETKPVQQVHVLKDGFTYPKTSEVMRVTISQVQ